MASNSTNPQDSDTCCICWETVSTQECGHITSKCCKHLIHINCFISYTILNKQRANKCPMCRYDINTGKPYAESEYPVPEAADNRSEYDSEDEYADEYSSFSDSESEDIEHAVTTTEVKFRTPEELQTYYTTPYVSPIITQPVNLANLQNYSDIGSAFYTSDKYDCLSTYNPGINGITIRYQSKPPLVPISNHRDFRCDGVPRCVSIQTNPNSGLLYVLIVYPDDGEYDKMAIYFPHTNDVIMSGFYEKLDHCSYSLDNLQITGFAAQNMGHSFIYLRNDTLVSNGLLAEVIELRKLKYIYNSQC